MLTAADKTCCYVNRVQAGVCVDLQTRYVVMKTMFRQVYVLTVADETCCYVNRVQAGVCVDLQ